MVTAADDVTIGEVARRVDRVEGRVEQGFSDLNARFDRLAESMSGEYVRHDLFTERCQSIDQRLIRIEGWQTWAIRIVLSAVILTVLAAVIGVGVRVGG